MRMTVRVTLGVLTAMLGTMLLLGIGAATASAAPHPAVNVAGAVDVVGAVDVAGAADAVGAVDAQPAAKPATPTTTAPATDYNRGQQQADSTLARRKVIIAVICVVLLGIVWVGHRAKGKHILRLKNLQNAKS